MADRPLRPCKQPGCGLLTREGYCNKHKSVRHDNRASAAARGYGYRWGIESRKFLAAHPWCAVCLREGRYEPAQEVDHIRPHKGDMNLFWDRDNWQALSHRCHSRKTARENGGFGNRGGG